MKPASKTNALRLAESAGLLINAYEYDISDNRIDANSIAEKIQRPPEEVFKTLVTQAPGHEYFVFIVPANGELDLKKAAKAAGKKKYRDDPAERIASADRIRPRRLFASGNEKTFSDLYR